MQPSGKFRGLDVGRVLIAEGAALHAEYEAERLDVAGQILEREGGGLPLASRS